MERFILAPADKVKKNPDRNFVGQNRLNVGKKEEHQGDTFGLDIFHGDRVADHRFRVEPTEHSLASRGRYVASFKLLWS